MAKKRKVDEVPLRRRCGAMAAHMMLLEKHPSFRAAQMRLEGATAKRRDAAAAKLPAVVTIKTVVQRGVQDGTSRTSPTPRSTARSRPSTRISARPIPTSRGRRRRSRDSSRMRASRSSSSRSRARRPRERFHVRRQGQEGLDGRHRAVSTQDAPESVGVRAHRRPPGLRAVSWRTADHRWRRDQLQGVRHHGHGSGAVQQRTDGDARGRSLPEPAAHLGRHAGLQRIGHGGRHAELRRAEFRHARLAGHHLQQRSQRRHVHELHGLHR